MVTERVQLALLRAVGFIAAACALLLSVHFASREPLLFGAISSLVAWYVGKATGTPIPSVLIHALQSMPPGKALHAVRKAALETQPERAEEAVQLFTLALQSMAPPPPAAPVRIVDDNRPEK